MIKKCDNCKTQPAMHECWDIQSGKKEDLCCQCHIAKDGIPADWHSGCMKQLKTKRNLGLVAQLDRATDF